MGRQRTIRDFFRRYLVLRVLLSTLFVIFSSYALSRGSVWTPICFGLIAVANLGLTAFYFHSYRRMDAALLDRPIDKSQQPSWRYLQPKKYPYVAVPAETSDQTPK